MTSFIGQNKERVAKVLDRTGITDTLNSMLRRVYGNNFIRAVNYHNTPTNHRSTFEKHLIYYQKYYTNVTLQDLESFFRTSVWHKEKPGLIISFDDGRLSNYDNAAPLLDKYGFVGWFFVPSALIDTPGLKQKRFAVESDFTRFILQYPNQRIMMNWDELKDLDDRHVIGCHTASHLRLYKTVPKSRLVAEIVDSKHQLEEKLCHPVDSFCWVSSEIWAYSSIASKIIRDAGYRFAFQTNSMVTTPETSRYHIQRTNIESDLSLELVKMQLCGMIDLIYWPKRKYINWITKL